MAAAGTGEELTIDDYVTGAFTFENYVLGQFSITGDKKGIYTEYDRFYRALSIPVPAEIRDMNRIHEHNFRTNPFRDLTGQLFQFVVKKDTCVFEHTMTGTVTTTVTYKLRICYAVPKTFLFGKKIKNWFLANAAAVMQKVIMSEVNAINFIQKYKLTDATSIAVLSLMKIPPEMYIAFNQRLVMIDVADKLESVAYDSFKLSSMDEQLTKLAQHFELPAPNMNDCMFEDALGELVTAYAAKKMDVARANVRAVYAGTAKFEIVNGEPKVQMIAEPAAKRAQPN